MQLITQYYNISLLGHLDYQIVSLMRKHATVGHITSNIHRTLENIKNKVYKLLIK